VVDLFFIDGKNTKLKKGDLIVLCESNCVAFLRKVDGDQKEIQQGRDRKNVDRKTLISGMQQGGFFFLASIVAPACGFQIKMEKEGNDKGIGETYKFV